MNSKWLVGVVAFAAGIGVGLLLDSHQIKKEQDRMSGLVRAVDVMNLVNPLRLLRSGQPDKATQVLEMSLRSAIDIARIQDHPHGVFTTSPALAKQAEVLLDNKTSIETSKNNSTEQSVPGYPPQGVGSPEP